MRLPKASDIGLALALGTAACGPMTPQTVRFNAPLMGSIEVDLGNPKSELEKAQAVAEEEARKKIGGTVDVVCKAVNAAQSVQTPIGAISVKLPQGAFDCVPKKEVAEKPFTPPNQLTIGTIIVNGGVVNLGPNGTLPVAPAIEPAEAEEPPAGVILPAYMVHDDTSPDIQPAIVLPVLKPQPAPAPAPTPEAVTMVPFVHPLLDELTAEVKFLEGRLKEAKGDDKKSVADWLKVAKHRLSVAKNYPIKTVPVELAKCDGPNQDSAEDVTSESLLEAFYSARNLGSATDCHYSTYPVGLQGPAGTTYQDHNYIKAALYADLDNPSGDLYQAVYAYRQASLGDNMGLNDTYGNGEFSGTAQPWQVCDPTSTDHDYRDNLLIPIVLQSAGLSPEQMVSEVPWIDMHVGQDHVHRIHVGEHDADYYAKKAAECRTTLPYTESVSALLKHVAHRVSAGFPPSEFSSK